MQFTTFALVALSVASSFAAPIIEARADTEVLSNAISAVAGARSAIDSQLAIIKNLVQDTVNQNVNPALVASLGNIAGEIANATPAATSLVTDVTIPLTEDEFNSLPGLLENARAIAADVQDAANAILTTSQASLAVRAEALLLIATVNPFVTPVTQFANAAISGTSGPTTDIILSTLSSLQSILTQLLGPILSALTGLF